MNKVFIAIVFFPLNIVIFCWRSIDYYVLLYYILLALRAHYGGIARALRAHAWNLTILSLYCTHYLINSNIMNTARRNKLNKLVKSLDLVMSEIENILEEEEEVFDNIPENLQSSERAEKSDEAIQSMHDIVDMIQDSIDAIEDITSS